METEKDLNAKAKRLAELPKLIELATFELGIVEDDEKPKVRANRGQLMQEKLWYENGHPYADWPVFLAEMADKERAAAAEAAKQAKTAAEKQAEADKLTAEREAKMREEFERETDAYTLWKRARASRTF